MSESPCKHFPIVPPTDPLWVEDELCSLDDAIERFFDMPDADPDSIDVWPARRMPKPDSNDVYGAFEDYVDENGELDPLIEEACEAAAAAFCEVMKGGEITIYQADTKRRINWRDLPGADEYIAFRKERGCDQ